MGCDDRSSGFRSLAGMNLQIHRPPLQRDAACADHGAYMSLCHVGQTWLGCPQCAAQRDSANQQWLAGRARAEVVERWEDRVGMAGVPERFRARSLESFEVSCPGQRMALEFAKGYADGFTAVRRTGRSAIFLGRLGTGKTHLAAGIAQQVMRTHKASVLFVTAGRMFRMVKDSWVKGSTVSESEVIASLVFPDLLIVDEVGVQQGTEFERNVMFDVFNERYELRKPALLLGNCTKDELSARFVGERVVDRLREDGGTVVSFTWGSQRGGGVREEVGEAG